MLALSLRSLDIESSERCALASNGQAFYELQSDVFDLRATAQEGGIPSHLSMGPHELPTLTLDTSDTVSGEQCALASNGQAFYELQSDVFDLWVAAQVGAPQITSQI